MTLLETWVDSICIEAAELLEHFQWKTDAQATEMLRSSEKLSEISNELADVMIYCLSFSDILRIDVSNAIQRKLQKNAEKYPVQEHKIYYGNLRKRGHLLHGMRPFCEFQPVHRDCERRVRLKPSKS